MRPRARRSMRLKIGLALGVVTMLAVLSLTAIQAFFEAEDLRTRTHAYNLTVSRLLAAQVDTLIAQTQQQLETLVADPALVADALAANGQAMNARLERIAPRDPDLTVMAAINAGWLVWATSNPNKGSLGSNLRDQMHIRIPMERGVPSVGEPRPGLTSGLPIVPLGMPIRGFEGQVIGVLHASLSLENLSEDVSNTQIGGRGYADLVASDGTRLTNPDPSRILTRAGAADETIARARRGDAFALETVDDLGQAVFAAAALIPSTGWVAHVQVPTADVLAPLYARLAQAAGVALLTVVAATAAGFAMAQRLTLPIAVLREATRRMARGEYVPSSAQVHSGDELEDLARDFDSMATRLQQSEERYRTVSELTSDFAYAYAVQADGTLTPEWATTAFTRITGFTIEEVAARGGWIGLIHPDDRPIAEQRRQVLLSGRSEVSEFRILTKSGDTCVLRVHARPVWDQAEERIVRIYGAAQDISESKRMEEALLVTERQLLQVEKLRSLGVMASGVAHQMNNILASVLGQADLLREQTTDPELRQQLESIIQAAQDGAAAVRRIQQFARDAPARGFRPVDLSVLAQDIVTATAPRWRDQALQEGREITVTVTGEGPVWVAGVAADLREALMNLMLNAVDALPSGGTIRVEVDRAGDRSVLRVVDNGVGISEDVLQRVYDPFFTTKPLGSGTGLGLALTYGIVQRHGGTIEVRSRLGLGTTVEILLAAVEASKPEEPSVARQAVPAVRVLAVDDEPLLVEQLRLILNLDGHQVRVCHGGAEAIGALDAEPFDVIITDLGMPGVNGWDVAREAKLRSPQARVGLVTGWAGELEDTDAVRDRGVDFVIAKPYRVYTVRNAIAKVLREGNRR